MADKYIDTLILQAPELGAELSKLADFHKRRLWHQLTLELTSFVKLPQARAQIQLIELYKKFISTFETKLNQLAFVRIAADISTQLEIPERIQFATTISELSKVLQNQEALIDSRSFLGQVLIQAGDLQTAKEVLQKAKTALDATAGVDASVYSNFFKAWAVYYKVINEAQEFYQTSIQFIAYTQLDTLPKDELGALAFDLGLAALLGDEIFNFGDLLEHPVLESLHGTQNEWLSEVINVFNVGDIPKWKALQIKYAEQLNQHSALKEKHVLLDSKIRIMCLVEFLWNKPSDQRTVHLQELSTALELSIPDVEMLVMRTLSLGLIRGTIDEVDQTVSVTWVQPHILNMQQINSVSQRLASWTDKVKNALSIMENGTTELGL